ncbi:chromate transporter [Escherichia coli]|uniref:chromate transporter n=1 Tax=Escherichia coli TaxID=562 RepID=UPI003965CF90
MPSQTMAMVDSVYRVGSLVFGGGHVVLPLLQAEVVPSGWVNNESFLAGYGAAQAVPGPFVHVRRVSWCLDEHRPVGLDRRHCVSAGYLRALVSCWSSDQCPFWERLRRNTGIQAAMAGINAAVVGLLLAALYQPVWTSAIFQPQDSAWH